MPSKSSVALTATHTASSVGASLTHFIRHYSRSSSQRHDLDETVGASISWTQKLPGGAVEHEVHFNAPVTRVEGATACLLTRALCHALIDRLPDVALAESLDTLRNIYEWSLLDAKTSEPIAHLMSAPIPAQLMGRLDREEFYASEE
jgi:hypothetical protein